MPALKPKRISGSLAMLPEILFYRAIIVYVEADGLALPGAGPIHRAVVSVAAATRCAMILATIIS